jgi:hypothetical protein
VRPDLVDVVPIGSGFSQQAPCFVDAVFANFEARRPLNANQVLSA